MGWKNVKEHYRIVHQVHITSEGLCIGSPYIHNIIVVAFDGTVKKRYDMSRTNEDLCRYQQEFDADPAKLRDLIQTPDTFSVAIPVYTYDGGNVLEKYCEEEGWPNVTHDGCLMYENLFSTDKAKVVRWAKKNACYGLKSCHERLDRLRCDVSEVEEQIKNEDAILNKLYADFPNPPCKTCGGTGIIKVPWSEDAPKYCHSLEECPDCKETV